MEVTRQIWHTEDNSETDGLEKPTHCISWVAIMICTYITDWATLNNGRSGILVLIGSAYVLSQTGFLVPGEEYKHCCSGQVGWSFAGSI